MANETELKYIPPFSVTADSLMSDPLIAPHAGEAKKLRMHTEYFDTPGYDAQKAGITLRRRLENGKSILYAKSRQASSGALSVRGEWSIESEDIKNAASLLAKAGAPTAPLCGMEIRCVASVSFERTECLVTPYEGFSFMLSFDDGLFAGKEHFCEIELELMSGSKEELLVFGGHLAKKLGLTAEPRSKYARALAFGSKD